MSIAVEPNTIVSLGKRKRNDVSYFQTDIDIDEDTDNSIQGEDDFTTDDDGTYGSRRKPRKSKRARKTRFTTPRPKRERPQKPFPFLSLPAELRDYIYELALTDNGGIALASKTKAMRRIVCRGVAFDTGHCWNGVSGGGKDSVPEKENSLTPALLAVNKQIHAEGTTWLYQQRIVLEDTTTLHTFLAAIGPTNRQIVTEIVVKGWGCGRGSHKAMNVAALTSAAECTNLKIFRLDCHVEYYRHPKGTARQLYRDGHYFFERFGAARGRKDAIVDVLQLSDCNFDGQGHYRWQADDDTAEVGERKEEFRASLRELLGC